MLIKLAYLKKKWFIENPKYFKTKYDAKLNIFFLNCYNFVYVILHVYYISMSITFLLTKFYYTYNNEDNVKNSSSLDNY